MANMIQTAEVETDYQVQMWQNDNGQIRVALRFLPINEVIGCSYGYDSVEKAQIKFDLLVKSWKDA